MLYDIKNHEIPRQCYKINFYSKRIQKISKAYPKWIYNRIAETQKIFKACLYENIYLNS